MVKSANKTPTNIFEKYLKGYKRAEFHADSKSGEKVEKILPPKSYNQTNL
jgi:hypothetical protein